MNIFQKLILGILVIIMFMVGIMVYDISAKKESNCMQYGYADEYGNYVPACRDNPDCL